MRGGGKSANQKMGQDPPFRQNPRRTSRRGKSLTGNEIGGGTLGHGKKTKKPIIHELSCGEVGLVDRKQKPLRRAQKQKLGKERYYEGRGTTTHTLKTDKKW